MNHIVDTCPLTKFEGGLNLLHGTDDDAAMRLESTATAALAKQVIARRDDMPPTIAADLRPCANGSVVRTSVVA